MANGFGDLLGNIDIVSGEINIECNPYPTENILALVKAFTRQYKDFPRVRFSF